jgi:hypothetical protein
MLSIITTRYRCYWRFIRSMGKFYGHLEEFYSHLKFLSAPTTRASMSSVVPLPSGIPDLPAYPPQAAWTGAAAASAAAHPPEMGSHSPTSSPTRDAAQASMQGSANRKRMSSNSSSLYADLNMDHLAFDTGEFAFLLLECVARRVARMSNPQDWYNGMPCERCQHCFMERLNTSNETTRIYNLGDLHGCPRPLLNLLVRLQHEKKIDDNYCLLDEDTIIVLTGDFADRGPFGLEVWHLVLYLLIQNPDQVFVIKANHEYGAATDFRIFECPQRLRLPRKLFDSVFWRVCVCVSVSVSVCLCASESLCLCVCVSVFVCLYVSVCVCACVSVCVSVCMCQCTNVPVCACASGHLRLAHHYAMQVAELFPDTLFVGAHDDILGANRYIVYSHGAAEPGYHPGEFLLPKVQSSVRHLCSSCSSLIFPSAGTAFTMLKTLIGASFSHSWVRGEVAGGLILVGAHRRNVSATERSDPALCDKIRKQPFFGELPLVIKSLPNSVYGAGPIWNCYHVRSTAESILKLLCISRSMQASEFDLRMGRCGNGIAISRKTCLRHRAHVHSCTRTGEILLHTYEFWRRAYFDSSTTPKLMVSMRVRSRELDAV